MFEKNGHVFEDYFEKAYYSYEIGLAKPDKAIFEFVLQDAGIKACETLLVDDAEANILAAKAVGFHTYLAKPYEDFTPIFNSGF